MVETGPLPIFKFRTADYPEGDRFHVWVKDNLCDCRFDDDGYGPFNAEATGAALGPLVMACRHWPARSRPLTYWFTEPPGAFGSMGRTHFASRCCWEGGYFVVRRAPNRSAVPAI